MIVMQKPPAVKIIITENRRISRTLTSAKGTKVYIKPLKSNRPADQAGVLDRAQPHIQEREEEYRELLIANINNVVGK